MNLVTKSLLALTCFVRRHPLLTVFILLLLFLTVTVEAFLGAIAFRVFGLPGKAFQDVGQALGKAADWLGSKPQRKFAVAVVLGLFFPLVGWYFLAWSIMDLFKRVDATPVSFEEPEG